MSPTDENNDDRYDQGNILEINSMFNNTEEACKTLEEVENEDDFVEFRADRPKRDCFICLTFSHAIKIKQLVDNVPDDGNPKNVANLANEFIAKRAKELRDSAATRKTNKVTHKPNQVDNQHYAGKQDPHKPQCRGR